MFYAGSYGGLLTRYDRITGQMRQINVWPENPMGHSSKDIAERFQWTFPIVFSPLDPRLLYVGSQHLWRTTNEGQNWERISGDLTVADPKTMGPSGGPITLDQTGVETYATLFTIAPSPKDANTIWTGSDDGKVSVTRNGGKTWQTVNPPGLPPLARISIVEASPNKPGTAYVAANRYQQDDWAPYFFRTDDYGSTWKKIVDGIGPRDFARAIREDPRRPGLLFAGTEHGIYLSFDDGAHWQPLRLNLPVTSVQDIAVKDNDLLIATHGRSFYTLENIGVLRQLTSEIAQSGTHLFAPGDAMRSVSRGITIDYYFAKPAKNVTVDILDAQGSVVRTFSSADNTEKPPARAAGEDVESGRNAAPPPVTAKAGMNRFVWDMRYPDATGFPGIILWAGSLRGPVALPGKYQVRLTVSGQTQSYSFAIVKNPLLTGVTDADLQAQFKLAMQIRDSLSKANNTVIRIRDLKKQLTEGIGKLNKDKDAANIAAGETLVRKLTDVEGEIYQYRNQSSQDPLNYPIKLNNKLAALAGVVGSTDARPTDSSYQVYKELSSRLEAQLSTLETIIKTDIEAFYK